MTKKAQECLDWIRKEYGINYEVAEINGHNLIDLVIDWATRDAEAEKQSALPKLKDSLYRIDYEEETDDSGRLWIKRSHFSTQHPESRHLKKYDAIKYVASTPLGWVEEGIMIINSFSYESDFAACAYICKSKYTKKDGSVSKCLSPGIVPGISKFSIATDDEIKELFDSYYSNNDYKNIYLTELCPKEIRKKYSNFMIYESD